MHTAESAPSSPKHRVHLLSTMLFNCDLRANESVKTHFDALDAFCAHASSCDLVNDTRH